MNPLFRADLTGIRFGRWQEAFPAVLVGRDKLLQEQFETFGFWGVESAIDLFDCDPISIRDEGTIKAFTIALCDRIAMRRSGDLHLVRFGQEEGVRGCSLSQFLEETSEVSAHFLKQRDAICLTIVACKMFPPYQTAALCQDWFCAQAVELTVTFRGPQAESSTSTPFTSERQHEG